MVKLDGKKVLVQPS
jgi:hypothetical protein